MAFDLIYNIVKDNSDQRNDRVKICQNTAQSKESRNISQELTHIVKHLIHHIIRRCPCLAQCIIVCRLFNILIVCIYVFSGELDIYMTNVILSARPRIISAYYSCEPIKHILNRQKRHSNYQRSSAASFACHKINNELVGKHSRKFGSLFNNKSQKYWYDYKLIEPPALGKNVFQIIPKTVFSMLAFRFILINRRLVLLFGVLCNFHSFHRFHLRPLV